MNVEKIKRFSSNQKFDNANNEVKARPGSTRKSNINKNADLNLDRNYYKKDFGKVKSQFDKYS